jgi:hypothetical protein
MEISSDYTIIKSYKALAHGAGPKVISNQREKSVLAGLLFLFAMLFVLPLQAQHNLPVAIISESGKITLSASAPLSASYQADISKLKFRDAKVAEAFFNRLTDGVTTFSLDFKNQKVTIILATKMLAEANMHWSVNQWNEYFSKKQESLEQAGAQ